MINKAKYTLALVPILLLFAVTSVFSDNGTMNNGAMDLSVSFDVQHVDCVGMPTGILSAVPDGGVPPYEYLWNTGQTGKIIDNLFAGTYSVTITDDIGTEVSESITINDPELITLVSVDIIDEDCYQENGAIFIEVTGGTAPYSYKWADHSTNQNLENASDGSYTVVVQDANGCKQKFGPFFIDSDCSTGGPCDDGPSLTDSSVNESNCDSDNGSIFLSITNEALPHTFAWTGGYDTEDITDLAPGTYTLTLTDANDCSQEFGPFTIGEDCDDIPCLYKPTVTDFVITDADCDQTNGAINITVDGGSPPFTFVWNTQPNATTEDVQNLAPGDYGVVITDADGCEDKFKFTVKEDCNPDPPCVAPIVSSVVVIESTCDNAEGEAFIYLAGGNAGHSFDWSPAVSSGSAADQLEAGTYSVTITDLSDADCNLVEVFTVGNSDGPQPTILSTTPASCNQDNGTAVMSDLSLTYVWDNGYVGNNPTNLTAGEHQVTATDPNTGCINVIEVVIPEFTVLQASANVDNQPTNGNADGGATINVTNGSFAYTYEWPDGGNTATRDDLEAGTYSVTVTDLGATGCVVVVNFVLTNSGSGIDISIAGNPDLNCIGDENGTVSYTLNPPNADVTITIIDNATGLEVNNGELSAGSYCMTATDNSTGAIVGGDCFEVTAPSQIDVDFASYPQDCDGLGNIDVVDIMGGNGGYVFDWQNVPGSNSAMNQGDLTSGAYAVTITDALGCTTSAIIPVADEGDPIDVNLVLQVNPECPNSLDGSVTVQGTGGQEPYTYVWDGNLGNEISPPLNGGVTTVEVTDALGCTTTQTYNLIPNNSLALEAPGDTSICADSISLSANAPGATEYIWYDADGNVIGNGGDVTIPVGVDPSQVTVVASNAEGCESESSFMLSGESLDINQNVNASNIACLNEDTPLNDLFVDPNPDYTYDWMPDNLIASGDGTATPVFVSDTEGANEISVLVTNAAGCSETLTFSIPVSNPMIQPDTTSFYDCQDLNVNFSIADIYPGAIWDFGDNSPTQNGNTVSHTYDEPGNYDIIVTFDPAIPCVDQVTYQVEVVDVPDNDVFVPDAMECEDVLLTMTADGTNGSTVTWTNAAGEIVGTGDTYDVNTGVNGTMEEYTATATNSFGCTSEHTFLVSNNGISGNIMDLMVICEDGNGDGLVELSPNSSSVTGIEWSSNNPNVVLDNSNNADNVNYSNAEDGDSLIVDLSNSFCSLQLSTTIEVFSFEQDDVDVTTDEIEIVLGEDAEFDIFNPSGYDIYDAEGNIIEVQNGTWTTTPDDVDEFTYTFTFVTDDGCETTRTITITVLNPTCNSKNIFFPNLFTPNGDGMNDVLFLRGAFIEEAYFAVYDRWGEKVFESDDISSGWDGTYKGKQLCNDVYGYYLRVRCGDGEEYYHQGNVTLMH